MIDEDLTDNNVGARRKRKIRDNIFVLNAVTNSVTQGTAEAIDVQVFDIEKCFDSLWMEECNNNLYETGFDNDKLPIIFLENQNAQIAIKTAHGITEMWSCMAESGAVYFAQPQWISWARFSMKMMNFSTNIRTKLKFHHWESWMTF